MADVSGAVFVIDDDPSMRAALGDLISSVGSAGAAICLAAGVPAEQPAGHPGLSRARREIARA